jgi:hypothetical protein
MVWKKLDDDLAAANMPYSSLLADGLTDNVNSYSSLNSGSTISWSADDGPMWASYGQPMGTVVTLDVGVNCGQIDFEIAYRTATGNEKDGSCGRLFVRHLTSTRQVTIPVPAEVVFGTLNLSLEFDAVSNWPSGPQAFFVAFQSVVLEDRGFIYINNANRNQVYCFPDPGIPGYYNLTQGEKYELLTVGGDKKYALEENSLGTYSYQIGFARDLLTLNAFVVWPAVDNSPALIPTDGTQYIGTGVDAVVRELGAFGLLSISYTVLGGPARNPRQLAHAPAFSLNSLSLEQSLAVVELRPDVASNATEARLGYLLQSSGDSISGVIATQADTVGRLSLSFRAVRMDDDTALPLNFVLDVLKENGAAITPQVEQLRSSVPRMSYQSAIAASPASMRVIEGARRGPQSWGMRDSMPLTDCLKGAPVYLETAPFNLPGVGGAIQSGSVATFKLTITGGEDLSVYVYGFNARFD